MPVATTLVVVFLFLTQTLMLGWAAYRDSPTWDEFGHLAAGISHWRDGTFNLYRVNPPLVRLVASAPVMLMEAKIHVGYYDRVTDPSIRGEFVAGGEMVHANGQHFFDLMTVARWGCIPFCLLGGWICFTWARQLYGHSAGILSLLLWTFCPNVIGYGHLIAPDMGATALGVAACYMYWKWLTVPNALNMVGAGLVLGLAELSKTTWIVLVLLWPILWLAFRLLQQPKPTGYVWREALQILVILVLSLWIINLGYCFERSFKTLGKYQFVSESLAGRPHTAQGPSTGNRFSGSWLGLVPVPLPENYLSGIDVQKADFERRMWSYLHGEWRFGGWWYYYVYGLLIKVPIGTWVLLGLAIVTALFSKGYAAAARDELCLLLPLLVVLAVVSSQTGFNHHLRYVLPIFPFAYIWISKLARSIALNHRAVATIGGMALVWSAVSSLWVYPHSLSYFNEFVGGPNGGHYHLGNSNIDWGQDLFFLKEWLDQHPEATPLHLAYDLSVIDPRIVGIDYTRPPLGPASTSAAKHTLEELGPLPGWHAISVNQIHRRERDFDYFLNLKPVAMAGYSIYIYHISIDEANRLRRKLGLPQLGSGQGIGR